MSSCNGQEYIDRNQDDKRRNDHLPCHMLVQHQIDDGCKANRKEKLEPGHAEDRYPNCGQIAGRQHCEAKGRPLFRQPHIQHRQLTVK